jgi:hypothetical protein
MHRNEPFRASIFVQTKIVVDNRAAMSRAVINAAKCARMAWMLRSLYGKTFLNSSNAGRRATGSCAVFIVKKFSL